MNSNSEKNKTGASSEYQENLDMLRQIDFFSGLPLEATKVFAYLCKREPFKPGDIIFQQGDDDGRAFFIVSGQARLTQQNDNAETTIREYGAGDFIGRMTLLGQIRRLFTLTATTEGVCLVITREKFTKALEKFPNLAPKFIEVVIKNIYRWEKRFLSIRSGDCRECLKMSGVSLV
jgi:CRP-like cAMP-binding protein